jgi:Zn-dependent peptidase ImmA (M78 family)
MDDPDAGRVVKAENKLIISLPKTLIENSRNKDGSYNENGVKKIREIMAHELGHIALHTDELLKINTLRGSKDLDKNLEKEALWFSEKLLRLRHERNQKMAQCDSF